MNRERTATKAEEYFHCTKRIRLPKNAIVAIEPARDGSGDAIIVTTRGMIRACETYEEALAQFTGSAPAGGADGKAVRNERN